MTPYKLFLAYFNNLYGDTYQKKFIENLKIDHRNNKTIIKTNYVEK